MIKPNAPLNIDCRLRSFKFMKNVTLDARGFLFLPSSENGPQEQVPFAFQILRPLPLFCAIGILKSSAIFRCFIIMFIIWMFDLNREFLFCLFTKFFSCHLTFSPGGMKKLTVQFVIKTPPSKRSSQTVRLFVILSNFLNVRVMWEE